MWINLIIQVLVAWLSGNVKSSRVFDCLHEMNKHADATECADCEAAAQVVMGAKYATRTKSGDGTGTAG